VVDGAIIGLETSMVVQRECGIDTDGAKSRDAARYCRSNHQQ
jgi:hypothetical protein